MRKMCNPCFEDFESKSHFEESKRHGCKACDCEPETCKRKECHFCPKPIIMECACGTGAIIPEIDQDDTFNPISLGCLTIDTTCLCRPMVKFDFSSTISYEADGDEETVELTFTLKKSCDGGHPVRCGSWDFRAMLDTDDEEITTSFTFSHCETSACPGCCVYTVEITRAIKEDEDDKLAVSNVVLSAIATSSC